MYNLTKLYLVNINVVLRLQKMSSEYCILLLLSELNWNWTSEGWNRRGLYSPSIQTA